MPSPFLCPICNEVKLFASHVCPPLWLVRDVDADPEDEWHEVRAATAERAAEKWAKDYDIQSGSWELYDRTLQVKSGAFTTGEDEAQPQAVETFTVKMENEPVYTAERQLPEEAPNAN